MPEFFHSLYNSPVGCLTLIATDTELHAILWENEASLGAKFSASQFTQQHALLERVCEQLSAYFAREQQTFDLPLCMQGTPFQVEVWQALTQIPYGKTISYAELADSIGRPKAVRAVGAAIGRNPLSIVVPCHRVIGKNGTLTGFAGGIANKATLLELERS